MLRDAANEIRLHPARFVATVLAVALSVGFLVAIGTMTRTSQEAMARDTNLPISRADVAVVGTHDPAVLPTIAKTDGVGAADQICPTSGTLRHQDASAFIDVFNVPGEQFRWAGLTEGRWAGDKGEITLSDRAAERLGARLGSRVRLSDVERDLEVVGITRDARPMFGDVAYTNLTESERHDGCWWVVRTDGAPADQVRDAVQGTLQDKQDITVVTADRARQEALVTLTAGLDTFETMLYGFGGIALLVGVLIISNTFTILFTQRRRQIALLRAVGASTGQVRGRLVLEAVLLGLAGSALGVGLGILAALVGSHLTGALFWGLTVDWPQALVVAGLGVLVTVLAVLGPSLSATRVRPVEALQTVPSEAQAKRLGRVRVGLCALALLAGAGLVGLSVTSSKESLTWAIGAGMLLSIGVLGLAPLYVPPLLRLLGRGFGFAGPTVRLAAENAARNPRRAGATSVALMLAVGLVVTLQVGATTSRTSALAGIEAAYPVDLVVSTTSEALPDDVRRDIARVPGVENVADVEVKLVEDTGMVVNANPGWRTISSTDPIPDGVALISRQSFIDSVDLPGVGPMEVRKDRRVGDDGVWVSETDFQRVKGKPQASQLWVNLTNPQDATAYTKVKSIVERYDDVQAGGSLMMSGSYTQAVNVLLMVVTALLGVAVLIALVGVGNTLGLSVLERQRESALLRALGMQRASLRLMLLVEALMLAVAGTIIGVLAGVFFGWLGASSVVRMIPQEEVTLHFAVDWALTLGLVAVCVVAACLASVLPGRRAANATPTEALAVE